MVVMRYIHVKYNSISLSRSQDFGNLKLWEMLLKLEIKMCLMLEASGRNSLHQKKGVDLLILENEVLDFHTIRNKEINVHGPPESLGLARSPLYLIENPVALDRHPFPLDKACGKAFAPYRDFLSVDK